MAEHAKDVDYYEKLVEQLTPKEKKAIQQSVRKQYMPAQRVMNALFYTGAAAAIGGVLVGIRGDEGHGRYYADDIFNTNVVRHHGDIGLAGVGMLVLSAAGTVVVMTKMAIRSNELAEEVIRRVPRPLPEPTDLDMHTHYEIIDPNPQNELYMPQHPQVG